MKIICALPLPHSTPLGRSSCGYSSKGLSAILILIHDKMPMRGLVKLIEDDSKALQRDHHKGNHYVGHKPDSDCDNRFELFILDEGQQKVEVKDETRTLRTPLYFVSLHTNNLYT